MSFLHLKKTPCKLITATFFLSSICFFDNSAVSQTNKAATRIYPTQIRLGIRTISSAIGSKYPDGSYGGFCGEFLNKLEDELSRKKLQIPVIPQDIANQYRGKEYPRYDGLITNKIEIECGPNSKSSVKLKDIRDNKAFRHKIKFSKNSFHATGIKLLVKKRTADELKNTSPKKLEEKLSALSIAVIKGTTIWNQFKTNSNYYSSYVAYAENKKANQKLDILDLALDDLETGKVKAFASDAIILRTLLEEGVKGSKPLKNQNYVIYPQEPEKYLPHLEKQQYAIAINKNTPYVKWLRKTIDRVLEKPSLYEAKQKIKEYENGKEISASSPPQLIEPNQAPDEEKGGKFTDEKLSDLINALATLITAVSGIVIGYWKFGKDDKAESSSESEDAS